MATRSLQKLIQVGNAFAVVAPKAWRDKHPNCHKVTVVYDDVILIFPEDQADRVNALFEQLIAKVVTESLTHQQQEMRPHGRPAASTP